ncbi:uncharacterized protein LOC117341115 [Pecten maximus]|uniref:uncharacterized protein LOC117341115 n=1 Tax=Pecten maximus TaxID=6579 RepID=UPI0014585118|nr:uncharacterized protein LOC117341115 [Pecten maximus]
MVLSLMAWNVIGLFSSSRILGNLLNQTNCDVCVVTEHKLANDALDVFKSVNSEYFPIFNLREFIEFPRTGKEGGVGILVKKTLRYNVGQVSGVRDERIVGLKVITQTDTLYIFGVYMQSDGDVAAYRDTLQRLEDLCTYYSEYGKIIIAGDFNARIYENHTYHAAKQKADLMRNLIGNINLHVCNHRREGDVSYTFRPFETVLDYVLIERSSSEKIVSCVVLENNETEIASDHLPVICHMDYQIDVAIIDQAKPRSNVKYTAWDKTTIEDLVQYQLQLSDRLCKIITPDTGAQLETDSLYEQIALCMTLAAEETVPKRRFKHYLKPFWSKDLSKLHKIAMIKRMEWMNKGRPCGMEHDSYKEYKAAKRAFRNFHDTAQNEYLDVIHRELDEAAEIDQKLFWRIVRKRTNKPATACNELAFRGTTKRDPKGIADLFAEFYAELYSDTSSTAENNDTDFPPITVDELDNPFTFEEVNRAIRSLSLNKAAGVDGIRNEHIRYGGKQLIDSLVYLFNRIRITSVIPKTWKKGLIIPIHKGSRKSKKRP